MPQIVECTTEEKVVGKLSPLTSTGQPTKIDETGELLVTKVSGEGSFAVIDDYTFELISADVPGDTVYLIEADADLGEGVEPLSETVTLTVSNAKAVNLGISFTIAPKG